jgi:hypothetical protein
MKRPHRHEAPTTLGITEIGVRDGGGGPFANLPEARSGRWGEGLTAAKMKSCRWLLCRKRPNSHNVECQTMPHRVLPVLSLLRPASLRFGIIRLSMRQPNRARLLTSVNAARQVRIWHRNHPFSTLEAFRDASAGDP